MHATAKYLVLDRTDPKNPRWVIAEARVSLPAVVPDDLARPGSTWLAEFGHDQFTWLTDSVDGKPGIRVPVEGREGFATRIVDCDDLLLEFDIWGLGWFDGWHGPAVDTRPDWIDPDDAPDAPGDEPDDD